MAERLPNLDIVKSQKKASKNVRVDVVLEANGTKSDSELYEQKLQEEREKRRKR